MANKRRRLVGRVVSDKMQKTVVVAIEQRKMHQVYKKVVKTTKKVMAHDETDAVGIGALVQVVESKPLSKNKRWVVEKVLEEAGARILQPVAGEVEIHPETQAEAEAIEAQPVVEAIEAPAEPENGADTPESSADVAEADEEAAS
jgi:small subunit ribosomal protein S17